MPIALQTQHSIAFASNINLLAAGASISETGSTGSGLYSGQNGALKSFTANAPTTKVIISDMPKIPGTAISSPASIDETHQPTDLILIGRSDMSDNEVKWLNFVENNIQIGEVCHGIQCCNYNISASINSDASQMVSKCYAA